MATQALILALIAALCSAGAYLLRPEALPWDAREREISMQEARALEDPLWIDARTAEEFALGSRPGALSLVLEDWEPGFAELLAAWTPERPIVVFCSSESCLRSHEVAERLRAELGAEEVYALAGGWESLKSTGEDSR